MSDQYKVNADLLNFRSSPASNTVLNVIARLKRDQPLTLVSKDEAPWWKMTAKIGNQVTARPITGYIHSNFVVPAVPDAPPVNTDPTPVQSPVPAVHYAEHSDSNRNSVQQKHRPLSESNMPFVDSSDGINSRYRILDWLDVEKSPRYKRTATATFCNIYAYDYCYLNRVYLPRVWWNESLLPKIATGQKFDVVYGTTVHEMNANMLFAWLEEWGDDFGWIRTTDLTELQNKVNEGRAGLICAQKNNLSVPGHITCVIPEKQGFTAKRTGNAVTIPLQSQAGGSNNKTFATDWWLKVSFREFGFWYRG